MAVLMVLRQQFCQSVKNRQKAPELDA